MGRGEGRGRGRGQQMGTRLHGQGGGREGRWLVSSVCNLMFSLRGMLPRPPHDSCLSAPVTHSPQPPVHMPPPPQASCPPAPMTDLHGMGTRLPCCRLEAVSRGPLYGKGVHASTPASFRARRPARWATPPHPEDRPPPGGQDGWDEGEGGAPPGPLDPDPGSGLPRRRRCVSHEPSSARVSRATCTCRGQGGGGGAGS